MLLELVVLNNINFYLFIFLLMNFFSLDMQVHYLLKDIDPGFIKEFVSRMDSFFLNCLPVTPNNHRVTEITHALSNGQTLIFVIIFLFVLFLS